MQASSKLVDIHEYMIVFIINIIHYE